MLSIKFYNYRQEINFNLADTVNFPPHGCSGDTLYTLFVNKTFESHTNEFEKRFANFKILENKFSFFRFFS